MGTVTRLQPRQRTILTELEPFLTDLLDRRGLSEHTIAAYRCDLRTLGAVLTAALDLITTAEIEAFLTSRREKPGTTNRRIASLSRFFQWALRQGYCTDNPVDSIDLKKDVEVLPRPIRSRDEQRALDRAITATPQPYRLIFTILRETGLRADEVLSLNVADVCLDAGHEGLRIRAPKNGHERVVVLTSDVMPRSLRGLRAWLRTFGDRAAPTRPLFCSNRGTRVAYDSLHYRWTQVCQAAGLINVVDGRERPRYTLHQLRHTAATAFIAQYPEQIVSRMLGHRDPRSTRRYADVTEDQVREALAARRRR